MVRLFRDTKLANDDTMPHEEVAWWNYNLPPEQRTKECPVSLRYANEKDRGIIGSLESDFKPMGWEEVKHLIGAWSWIRILPCNMYMC